MNVDMILRVNDRRYGDLIYCTMYYKLRRHEGELVWWHHGSSYSLNSFEGALSQFVFETIPPFYPKIIDRDEGAFITILKYDDYPL